MNNPIIAVWNYIKEMNTGVNGKLSINRNMAWGVGTLVVFIQIFSLSIFLYLFIKILNSNVEKNFSEILQLIDKLIIVVEFFNAVDISFILLALGITSIEKLVELVQKLRFGIFGGQPPEKQTPTPEPLPINDVVVTTETTVSTNSEP